jgi:aminoglycoside phosphotransferase (APT) family kinase protein
MAEADWRTLLVPLLRKAGLDVSIRSIVPFTGGVSSDIVRVDLGDGSVVCAKRALPRLKVAGVWEAPLERNHYEIAWLKLAASIVPKVAPKVLGEDELNGIALLEFLAPQDYLVWKDELLAGRFEARIPDAVASALSRIHTATWKRECIAREFPTDRMFDALRLAPYLRTLAERTPDLADCITNVADEISATHVALVHGDVSPKNILISRQSAQPVLLDAECAWFGDPAFDAAFCMNHLFLKAIHVRAIRPQLVVAAGRFFATWLAGLPGDCRTDVEQRLARLLPCLLLARVDGKSPVEYLDENERAAVRAVSRPLIAEPAHSVDALIRRFVESLPQQDPQ